MDLTPTNANNDSSALSPQQRELYDALTKLDAMLGTMYHGAVAVFVGANPDRLALAAHNFREIMEKLTWKYNVSRKDITLKEEAFLLETKWVTSKTSASFINKVWEGEIDPPLRSFLTDCDDFFSWLKRDHPTREEHFLNMSKKIEGSFPLSPRLAEEKTSLWKKVNGFFQKVSHHQYNPTVAEFEANQEFLEKTLTDLLLPKTFPEHDAIDELIREGEL